MHPSMRVQGLEPDIEQMRRQHKDDLRHATQQAQEMAKYVHPSFCWCHCCVFLLA